MTGLYPYQRELLQKAETSLRISNARVMLQLPTGGGKTRIAGELLARWLRYDCKAVWLTHREHLAYQTRDVLDKSGVRVSVETSWVSGRSAPTRNGGVVILMAQTVSRRNHFPGTWKNYDRNDLLIVDEAHRATAGGWQRAIEEWPGVVLGMTATPWRLSKTEGFDHLFNKLLIGPQVSDLQSGGYLCEIKVLMPSEENRIRGGTISSTTLDFIQPGIEKANHPDIMTVGALRFWSEYAHGRQTIVYGVSKGHARNLEEIFYDAGISAAVIDSDTVPEERTRVIDSFRDGMLSVLINVEVITEGFDLPDASCVVMARPTMSLTLYLQMVGRGLRHKPDGGDCLLLDLAGNVERHGLPEEERQWSLKPRGQQSQGTAPVVRCPRCDGVSPAASHSCKHCDAGLGNDCGRCGRWRATRRWLLVGECTYPHEAVCDFCHRDAHLEVSLPVKPVLEKTAIDRLLFDLVDEVRRRLLGDSSRQTELIELIARREQENSNSAFLGNLFDGYISRLPVAQRPANNLAIGDIAHSWTANRQEELDRWIEELAESKSGTAIEEKVRRGCYEQLQREEDSRALLDFNGLTVSEMDKRIEEYERERHICFLLEAVDAEERERINWKSQWNDLVAKRQAKTDTEEDHRRIAQLTQQVISAVDRRLRTIRRQFETRWPEIWGDYK